MPGQVERGRYRVRPEKRDPGARIAGLGAARGFELDLYDGDCFLIGDRPAWSSPARCPVPRPAVTDKTRHPEAMQGERGPILGRWTANLPGQHAELVFRPGRRVPAAPLHRQRRRPRTTGCTPPTCHARTLVSDSRFVQAQTHGLDYYGNTLTIFGGSLGPPRTYTVNLGRSTPPSPPRSAADAAEAQVDARWLARVPIGPLDPDAVQIPPGTSRPIPIRSADFRGADRVRAGSASTAG